jgi:myo-inositol-1(or 4)-monophosphatase
MLSCLLMRSLRFVVPEPYGRSFEELANLAVQAVCLAAEIIRAAASSPASIGTKSSATDVVTQTDIDAEAAIIQFLLAATPDAGVVGEESSAMNPTARLQWVIDPLDGTVNFLYRVPIYAVSVAAAVDGVFVAGAILDVVRNELFEGHVGGGARSVSASGVRQILRVSDCDALRSTLVATGFSYTPELRVAQGAIVADLVGVVRDVRCFGSAALQLCWLADGRIDAYFERDIKLWDWAAGSVIAGQAGAYLELPCPENNNLMFSATPGVANDLRGRID